MRLVSGPMFGLDIFPKTSWIREIERLTMNNKFTVNDLNLYYGDFHALKNINMDIKEKEITAFIGPSGCGKSTF